MARLLVLKFGGHALATPARIRIAARRIAAWRRRGVRIVAVASAPAGLTDRLLGTAAHCTSTRSHRELDRLLATGEDRSAALELASGGTTAVRPRARTIYPCTWMFPWMSHGPKRGRFGLLQKASLAASSPKPIRLERSAGPPAPSPLSKTWNQA